MTATPQPQLGARALARRTREVNDRIGKQLIGLREEAGVTRAQLATCAGVTQAYLWKIESGVAHPSVAVLVAIGNCLGADLAVRYFPGVGPRIHDRFQAPMVEALIRSLGPDWRAQPEVAVPAARGVIDVVLRRQADGCLIACECHSELRRLELVVRRLGEKAEALAGQVANGAAVSRMLLLRSTVSTRSIARAYEATLAAAFPARMTDAIEAFSGGSAWPGPAIVWVRLEGGRAQVLPRPPRGVRVGR
jgi:transcriptional regulator with XRE-family HTH domain